VFDERPELLDSGLNLAYRELDLRDRRCDRLGCIDVLAGSRHIVQPFPAGCRIQVTMRAMVASSRSGLNGFTTQPVAPAALPSSFFSVLASVVNTNSGTPR
jgi:hypothetical protein